MSPSSDSYSGWQYTTTIICSLLGESNLCHSLLLTSFITDVIKNAVGRPRPDLIARCKPVSLTQELSIAFDLISGNVSNKVYRI